MRDNILRIKYVKILEILKQESDESRPLSTPYMIKKLGDSGIFIDRRTLANDVKILNSFGYEIHCIRTQRNGYYIIDRKFDVPELRILMDAVESATFIPQKTTEIMLDKIADLGGSYRKTLQKRENRLVGAVKKNNHSVMYSIDKIEEAINKNKKITFKYFDLDIHRKKVYRKEGKKYEANPIATIFADDKYYLACYSDKYQNISNYRIDRMDDVALMTSDRTENEQITNFNIAEHKKQTFGMFAGKTQNVLVEFDEDIVEIIFDKFGEDITIYRAGDKCRTKIPIVVSNQFYGAILGLGEKIKIVEPKSVAQSFKSYVQSIAELY